MKFGQSQIVGLFTLMRGLLGLVPVVLPAATIGLAAPLAPGAIPSEEVLIPASQFIMRCAADLFPGL